MKKTYLSPATSLHLVEMQTILVGSDLIIDNVQNLAGAPETDVTSGNLSRRHSIWDDEEQEEE